MSDPYTQIVSHLNSNARLIRHWPLTGGVSAQIEAIEYARPDGALQRVVVRAHRTADWKPQSANVTQIEYALLQRLCAEKLPVPEPLMLDISGDILPAPYFVMAMIEGTTEVVESQRTSALQQMALFLRRLHRLDVKPMALPMLPTGDDPVAGALAYIPSHPRWQPLRAAVESWRVRPSREVLLHGDFWPGNVIWQNNEIAAVIDWEDASIGSPLSDLAGCRSELMVKYGAQAMETFTEYYLLESPLDLTDLPLWEVYGGFAALATMTEWGLPVEEEAHRRRRTQEFVARAESNVIDRSALV